MWWSDLFGWFVTVGLFWMWFKTSVGGIYVDNFPLSSVNCRKGKFAAFWDAGFSDVFGLLWISEKL